MANVRWQASIVDGAGDVLPSASVQVYLAGTLTDATIFSDAAGTPKSNPFTADANGFAFFYAAEGLLDVVATSGVDSLTWEDVELIDQTTVAGALQRSGGAMTGELVTDEIKETVHVMTTVDVDPANGSIQSRVLAGNETLTFGSIQPGQSVLLKVVPGAFVLTLTNIAKWTGDGAAPSALSAEHWLVVTNIDGTIVGTDLGGVL